MKTTDRTLVYFGGFVLGMMLVSLIMSRRAARDEASVDPWVEHNMAMVAEGAAPLPESAPESIRKGRIIGYGLLPNEADATERVWLLNFDKSYPYVRMVQSVEDDSLRYMAADQIKLTLNDGVDVTRLKSMLDQLGLRLRMFNRKKDIAVIGVLHTGIDAVPETLEAIQPWADLYEEAGPDWIVFKGE